MTAAMFVAVTRQPWQARRGRHGLWWALVALLALPLMQALRYGPVPLQIAGTLAIVVALWWWWTAVDGLLAQNQPALARLLPGQVRTLRIALLWHALLAGALALGGAALLVGPHAESVGWVIAGLLLTAWTQRRPWLWALVWLLPVAPWSLRAGLLQVMAWPVAAQLALLAGAVALLMSAVGGGGRMHRRVFVRRRSWQAASQASKQGRGVPATARLTWLRRATLPFTWPDRWARQRLLQRPDAANALRRLDLGLQTGTGAPMLAWLLLLCFGGMLLALAVARAWHPDIDWSRVVDGGRIGLCLGLFGVLTGAQLGRLGALWGRRREQALLVLLPGPPAGAPLAAALERQWQRDGLLLWVLGTVLVLAIAAQGRPGSLQFVAGFAAALLPLGTWLRARWRRPGEAPNAALPAIVVVLLAGSAATGAQLLAVPAAASVAAGVALYLAVRLRSGAPRQALLPAGRTPG
jgi:hypothetical protein